MGKQVRKTFKPRTNPLAARGINAATGVMEGVADQQLTLQPDQVLPVVDKVQRNIKPRSRSSQKLIYLCS